jgi:dihydroorotate dehydrogenase (fumarate)
MSAADLSTDYLGLSLRSPLVASSSPLTGDLEGLRRLEDAGAGAVVLPSLFEEQIEAESLEVDRMLETGAETFAEAPSYFPEFEDYQTGPDRYLELVTRAKQALEIPVIASLNGTTPGGWVEHARLIEEAGADALELNLYLVAADPALDATTLEQRDRELVAQVRAAVSIPLAIKLSPYFTALGHFARGLVEEGVNGLVLFNRFYQPDIDLERLTVTPELTLSRPEELRLPLRWIAILREHVDVSLAATSGVHRPQDALKALLAGANVAMMASALLRQGPGHLRTVALAMAAWMQEHEYESVRQLCGSMSHRAVPDPLAFERAQYWRTLQAYTGHFQV